MSQVRRPPLKEEVLGDGLATGERVLMTAPLMRLLRRPLCRQGRPEQIDPWGCHNAQDASSSWSITFGPSVLEIGCQLLVRHVVEFGSGSNLMALHIAPAVLAPILQPEDHRRRVRRDMLDHLGPNDFPLILEDFLSFKRIGHSPMEKAALDAIVRNRLASF